MKSKLVFKIMAVLLLVCSASALNVDFYTPTPANNTVFTSLDNYSVHVVLNYTQSGLAKANYTHNGTSYNLFDGSLVLSYSFDNLSWVGDTNTVIIDESQSSNNGALVGGYYTAGKYGYGIRLNGLNQFVNASTLSNLPTRNSPHTMCAWINPANIAPPQIGGIISLGGAATSDNLFCSALAYYNNNLEIIYANNSDTQVIDTSVSPPKGVWSHACLVYNTTNFTLYYNGLPAFSIPQAIIPNITYGYAKVGWLLNTATAQYFNGTIDEARVWNRALTAAEIQQYYYTSLRRLDNQTWDFSTQQVNNTWGVQYFKLDAEDGLGFTASSGNFYVTFNNTAPASTTTTTLPYNTSRVCLTNSSYSTDVTYLCYQETATAPTACGGLGTGSYQFTGEWSRLITGGIANWTKENTIDGNWNTLGSVNTSIGTNYDAYLFINYTKPSNALSSSLWQIKFNTTNIQNVSLPIDCWSASANKLSFRILSNNSFIGVPLPTMPKVFGYCWNSTDWVEVASSPMFPFFYEDGMWWVLGNASHNYSLTFKEEESGNIFNFSRHQDSYLDVICPTYGSDRLVLNYASQINISTREQPTLSAVIDGGQQLRQLMLTNNGSVNMFLVDGLSIIYTFNILDYTNRCHSSILQVQTTVNNTKQVIELNQFTLGNPLTFSLRNNTPYTFTLNCNNAEVRNYGTISLLPTDINKNIIIQDVSLALGNTSLLSGGVSITPYYIQATNTAGIILNKTSGSFATANITLSLVNLTNGTKVTTTVNSISMYSFQNGDFSFPLASENNTYIISGVVTNDNGYQFPFAIPVIVIPTWRLIDLHIPSGGLFGVTQNTIYNLISSGLIFLTFIGLTKFDVGFGTGFGAGLGGFIVIILALFLQKAGWLTGVTIYQWGLIIFMIIVGYLFAERSYKK